MRTSTTVHLSWFTLYKYILSWLECFVFCFTLGSAWVFTALDSLSRAGLCWSFCLSSFISIFAIGCSSFSHVLVNFYVFGISIMLFSDCIMYLVWNSVVVASWTTMLFYIPLRVIMFVLCLWFYIFDFICSKFIYNLLFRIIQVWHVWIIVDLNGTKLGVVTTQIYT